MKVEFLNTCTCLFSLKIMEHYMIMGKIICEYHIHSAALLRDTAGG